MPALFLPAQAPLNKIPGFASLLQKQPHQFGLAT